MNLQLGVHHWGLNTVLREGSSWTCSPLSLLKGEEKKNVTTTIDTLPQMHIHTTLTSTPSPSPATPNSPSPSSAIVYIDAFQRRDLRAVAPHWRAAFDCCDRGKATPAVLLDTQIETVCTLTCIQVKLAFRASTISPPFAAPLLFFLSVYRAR